MDEMRMVRALAQPVLEASRGRWQCLPCWAAAARITSDQILALRLLALELAKTGVGDVVLISHEPGEPHCDLQGPDCDSTEKALPTGGILIRANPST